MATSCASRRTWAFAKQADHAPDGNITAFGLLDRAQLRGSQNKGTGHACILRLISISPSIYSCRHPVLLLVFCPYFTVIVDFPPIFCESTDHDLINSAP